MSHTEIHPPTVQETTPKETYSNKFSLNSISTMRNSCPVLSPSFALNKSSSLATGTATSTICPKASPSLLVPLSRIVISFVNTGFTSKWTYPRLLSVSPLKSILYPHKFPADSCAYAIRSTSDRLHPHVRHVPTDRLSMQYPLSRHSAIHSVHYHQSC